MPPSADANRSSEPGQGKLFLVTEPTPEVAAPSTTAQSPPASGDAPGSAEHRRAKRQRVLKLARLIFGFGGSSIDCLVIDESRLGVMLETTSTTDVPERVQITFLGGPTFAALRRWANGNKVGLEYVGLYPEDEVAKRQVRAVRNILRDVGVHAAVQMLREADFFENSELRLAAEDAEAAIIKLETALG